MYVASWQVSYIWLKWSDQQADAILLLLWFYLFFAAAVKSLTWVVYSFRHILCILIGGLLEN